MTRVACFRWVQYVASMRVNQTRVSHDDGFNAWMNTGVGLDF